MTLSKEFLLEVLYQTDTDKALDPLYELLGPSIRSEYQLEGQEIVDLDWETYGIIVTYVHSKAEQVRLSLKKINEQNIEVWLGDGVHSKMTEQAIEVLYARTYTFYYKNKTYMIAFEFDKNGLAYVVLSTYIQAGRN